MEIENDFDFRMFMQIRAKVVAAPHGPGGSLLFPVLGRGWVRLAPRFAIGPKWVLWAAAALATFLLHHAVAHVWQWEGTTVAAISGGTAGAESWTARGFYGRRLEPESVVLHGAGQLEGKDFESYGAAILENKPLLAASSVDLSDDLQSYFAQLRRDLEHAEVSSGVPGLVPQIGLSLNAGTVEPSGLEASRTEEGHGPIAELVSGLQALHRPVFLRIGPGCNKRENGYNPARYSSAFRQVARAVRAAGLKEVAIVWEWSPESELEVQAEGAPPTGAAARWQEFYPGDDYVDWWGMTLYSEPAIESQTTAGFLAAADQHGFPVMIADAGPRGHEVSEGSLVLEDWFHPFFRLLGQSRGVKAFSYTDRDWRNYPQWSTWGDSRVEANPEVLAYMRSELRLPLFARPSDNYGPEALLRIR